jgi:hypothetical protein
MELISWLLDKMTSADPKLEYTLSGMRFPRR